jgi:hypothetical protein
MSGMLDVTHQSDRPQDYKGQVFIGRVVVNDDIKKFHRIKVEIPDMWDEYTQDQLPWCIPDHLAGGSGPTETEQNIPETGSFVYVTFQNGDNHFPVYHGGVRDYQSVNGVLDTNYPHRIGWQRNSFKEVHDGDERKRMHAGKEAPEPYDRRGHHFFLDRMTNEVEYEHPTKTRINIAPNGSVFLEVRERGLPDGGDFITHTDRHYIIEVSNATSDGPPGHYYCDVLEDWWETHVETHVLLESRTDRMDLRAPKNIRIESNGADVEVISARNVMVTATGNIVATAGGNIDFTASRINLNAPEIKMGGNVTVTGNISASGTIVDGDGDGGA